MDDESSIATIKTATDQGISLIDTADHYGGGHNETLIGRALRPQDRDKVVLSAKFGVLWVPVASALTPPRRSSPIR